MLGSQLIIRKNQLLICLFIIICSTLTVYAQPVAAQGPLDLVESASGTAEETVDANGDLVESQPSRRFAPPAQWSLNFSKLFWAVVVFLVALFGIKYLTSLLETMAEQRTSLRLNIKRLIPVISIVSWLIVSYIIVVDVFAPPMETIIAVSASAGIAIGFASQDILKNIFGGITILMDRPFQVGDKIEVGEYYGEVTQIGLRSVRIETPDDSSVAVPNGEIMHQLVSNSNSGQSNAQVVSEFYLPPDIDLIMAKKIAYRAAAVSRYVYLNKPIAVIIQNEIHQGRSLLKMRLKAYVLDVRYEFKFASEMTEIVLQEFLRAKLITAEQLSLVQVQGA